MPLKNNMYSLFLCQNSNRIITNMKKIYIILLVCIYTNICVFAQKVDFNEFLNNFYSTDCVSYEKPDYFAEIKEELSKRYLPIPLSPCSIEKLNDWRGAAKWQTDGMVVVIAERYNDVPCEEEGYPWMERWLVSYDHSGNLIDYILAVKSSDRYFYEIDGTISPTSISTISAAISKETLHNMPSDAESYPCSIEFYYITMDENGHFHKNKSCIDKNGLVIRNKVTNKFEIKFEK